MRASPSGSLFCFICMVKASLIVVTKSEQKEEASLSTVLHLSKCQNGNERILRLLK
ncbi:hypothetical protein VCR4J5_200403 [Vibrio crassostreae]|uniref:Uncharacterized protein n=1 Tax=Vibrio crassostreae TaxID=246167 RepID=A0ABM9QUR9_9VIBR|nr:hypothetical protein VCR20J5_1240123 [Vibrio crassostreae]CDT36265.1 hypothetical protein VCR4J5_200403 [Vibrio crassostreae]CDT36506.1 hypothetical protein VCR15J5_570215 [Vibrio crassostreae]